MRSRRSLIWLGLSLAAPPFHHFVECGRFTVFYWVLSGAAVWTFLTFFSILHDCFVECVRDLVELPLFPLHPFVVCFYLLCGEENTGTILHVTCRSL